jgi:hypothetical protein
MAQHVAGKRRAKPARVSAQPLDVLKFPQLKEQYWMQRKIFFTVLFFFFIGVISVSTIQSKETVRHFSGNWIVKWLSNNSINEMILNQTGAKFSGTYINDGKDRCVVSRNWGRTKISI